MNHYTLVRCPQYHIWCALNGGVYDPEKDYVGARNDWKAKLIPKKRHGCSFNESAFIHDAEYLMGGCEKDREAADLHFYENMKEAVRTSKPRYIWGLDWARKLLGKKSAWVYYKAVSLAGADAFNFHNECKHLRKS
jgi:hypothetical protein